MSRPIPALIASIPAMLSKGETVATAAGTAAGQNAQLMTSINSGAAYTSANGAIAGIENSMKNMAVVMAAGNRNISVESTVTRDGVTTIVQEGNADFANENNRTENEASI